MITIPLWVFIVLSFLSAIGGITILLVIFAHIRIRTVESKRDEEIRKIWDNK